MDWEKPQVLLQFSCQNLSAVSECQEMDILSGKRMNFRWPLIQSFRLDKSIVFPLKKLIRKTGQFLFYGTFPAQPSWQNIPNSYPLLLNGEILAALLEAGGVSEDRRWKYPQRRPHSFLGHKPPLPETFKFENLIVWALP
jgi:hypothetical protein